MISYSLSGDGIGELVLNRASHFNAVSVEMWGELAEVLETLAGFSELRVLVLRSGVEGAFCPGADIGEFPQLMESEGLRHELQLSMQACCNRLESLPIATIAMIDGPCVGGGCSLAVACDFRIASDRSTFGVTPAKLGLIYSLGDTRRLARTVGVTHAKKLLFTARLVDAERALAIGLVDTVFDAAALEEEGLSLARSIARNSAETVAAAKEMFSRIESKQTDDDEVTQARFRDSFGSAEAARRIAMYLSVKRERK
ncbi:MAG: enoyl-CoA hydratase/isomerase family protein [Gammaproteobacteria bacterium]|nr:enoyl-CoA hydratase/isomerase family protein [Gammaproteobacteria bacterium]